MAIIEQYLKEEKITIEEVIPYLKQLNKNNLEHNSFKLIILKIMVSKLED